VLGAFFFVGLTGMLATMKTGQHSAVAGTQLSASIDKLGEASQEIVRVEGLNTELQKQLLKQSSTIVDLSHITILTATGGDSFCYMIFPADELGASGVPTFVHVGNFPLTDVNARDVYLYTLVKRIGQCLTSLE
jgi:hypothetical protein